MKLHKAAKAEIISQLLPLLDSEAMEDPKTPTRYEAIIGRALINEYGIHKDARGDQIRPGIFYDWPIFDPRPVDHKNNISRIIEDAADNEEMDTRLAEYLVKFAKSREQIQDNIKSFLN